MLTCVNAAGMCNAYMHLTLLSLCVCIQLLALWMYLIYVYRLHRLCSWHVWEGREKGGGREKIRDEEVRRDGK